MGLMTDIHNDVFQAAAVVLRERNFVIFEEALFRSSKLKHRKDIQWRAIKDELQDHFQCQMLSISRAQFREQINAQYEPLRVLAHVKEYLAKGNGNETAGFSFPGWKRDITERKIAARRHTAQGFGNSADRLQVALDQNPALPEQTPLVLTGDDEHEHDNQG
jgi:hypothetical protein